MGLFDFFKKASKEAESAISGAAATGEAAVGGAASTAQTAAGGAASAAGSTLAAGAEAIKDAFTSEEGAIGSLLGEGGAKLSGLLDKLNIGGLDDVVKSWIGTGENKEVTAEQVKSALGSEDVASVASKLGVSEDEAANKIAKALPGLIDKLTPDGLVPDPEALANKITGLFK